MRRRAERELLLSTVLRQQPNTGLGILKKTKSHRILYRQVYIAEQHISVRMLFSSQSLSNVSVDISHSRLSHLRKGLARTSHSKLPRLVALAWTPP